MDQVQSPSPHVVHVAAPQSSGLIRIIGLAVGMLVLGVVFVAGMGLGAVIIFAGSSIEAPVLEELYRDGGRDTVAILTIEGVIDGHRADVIRVHVDHVLASTSIKAVVLRVDSPGGGVAASDQIWFQVGRMINAGLPIVSSYGGVAASGGYYVSCATDHIVAEPTCITGSIGVIAQTFIFKDLMEKVGIEPVTLMATDSPEKDVGNPWRAWTDKDRQQYLTILDSAYDIFNKRVRDGRRAVISDPAKIDELADGSIYTASAALDNGLIDSIGYLDDAVAVAESMAGLRKGSSTVVVIRQPTSLLGQILGASAQTPRTTNLRDAQDIRTLVNELSSPRLMYLMR